MEPARGLVVSAAKSYQDFLPGAQYAEELQGPHPEHKTKRVK